MYFKREEAKKGLYSKVEYLAYSERLTPTLAMMSVEDKRREKD